MPVEPVQRSDISRSVIHFTRERIEYKPSADVMEPLEIEKTVSAFEVLKEIMKSGTIKGSGNAGYVKGKKKAVCLSEIPLSAIRDFASPPSDKNARYRYYGIALSKKAVFALGGRPVIYLPDSENSWIPDEEKWRQVRYEFGEVDWTHEREWRIPSDLDLKTVPGLYAFVWNTAEAREIRAMTSPVQNLIRGVLPMEHLTMML